MKHTLIVVTDFGDDFAAAQVKLAAIEAGFDGHWVENHSVTPFSVSEGAFQIQILARHAPKGAVIVGVIDPGVGSSRKGLVIKTRRGWLVGPDNGLLWPEAKDSGVEGVWVICEDYFGQGVSTTFHGRDVFIKTGALVANGKSPEEWGWEKIDKQSICKREFKNGEVVHVDAFGNVKVHVDERPDKLARTFADVGVGEPLAYWGSSDTLELAVNQGRGDEWFGVELGKVLNIDQVINQ